MERKSLIIFDLDGTLIDTSELWNVAYDYVFAHYKIKFDIRSVQPGVSVKDKIKMIKALGYEFDDAEFIAIRDRYVFDNLNNYIGFDKNLYDFFTELAVSNTIAVATNASTAFATTCLNILNLTPYVHQLNTIDEYPPKPDTLMFTDIMRKYSVEPAHTIIVEDSPSGVECATSTGATVYATTGPSNTLTIIQGLLK